MDKYSTVFTYCVILYTYLACNIATSQQGLYYAMFYQNVMTTRPGHISHHHLYHREIPWVYTIISFQYKSKTH